MLLGVTFFSYAVAVSSGNHYWQVLAQASNEGIVLTPQQILQLQQYFHLGEPLWSGYFLWLGGLLQGNLGLTVTGQSVASTIVPWILPTLALQVPY